MAPSTVPSQDVELHRRRLAAPGRPYSNRTSLNMAGWKHLIFRKLSEPVARRFPRNSYSKGSLSGTEYDIHFPQCNHGGAPSLSFDTRYRFHIFFFRRSFCSTTERRTTSEAQIEPSFLISQGARRHRLLSYNAGRTSSLPPGSLDPSAIEKIFANTRASAT